MARRQFGTADAADRALQDLVTQGLGSWESSEPGKRGQPTRRFVLASTADRIERFPVEKGISVDDEWGQI